MTGHLLMSTDKKTWQELSSNAIADFAVSPEESAVLIATTQEGLTQSTDLGKTFEPVASAPVMVFIGWSEDGTVAGVTPKGICFTAANPTGAPAAISSTGCDASTSRSRVQVRQQRRRHQSPTVLDGPVRSGPTERSRRSPP